MPPDIVDWTRNNVKLPAELTSRPGWLRLDPYQKEPLRAMADPNLRGVSLMCPSQSFGKTLIFAVLMGYTIDVNPQPIFFMHASEQGLRKFLREKLGPLVATNARLDGKIQRGARGIIPMEGFSYPGGYCTMTTARSVSGRHGTTASTVIADEVDDYGIDEDLSTLTQRAVSYPEHMVVITSTPTEKGASQIEAAYNAGSQEEWQVQCPYCGEDQVMSMDGIDWVHRAYRCVYKDCQELWSESDRIKAINRGSWLAGAPIGLRRSFHTTQLASKNCDLEATLSAFETYDEREFTTQCLALPFEWIEIPPVPETAVLRKEEPPFAVKWRSVGVDVQGDRIEASVVAFSAMMDQYHLERHFIIDRTADESCWRRLKADLKGIGTIQKMAVDGGFDYEWINGSLQKAFGSQLGSTVEIVRGYSGDSFDKPLRQGKMNRKGRNYIWGSTDEAKRLVMLALASGKMTVGPKSKVTERQVSQLVSEELKREQGRPSNRGVRREKRYWHLPKGRRNEVLDCVVYAMIGIVDVASKPAGRPPRSRAV